MNILIVTQYFYPETFKSTDLAFELQKRGHQVTVLTGIPNYPEGKIYEEYGYQKNRNQTIDGVEIIRSLLLPRGSGGGARLFLNYYSFAFFASLMARKLAKKKKFDAIIVHEPSPITQFYPALTVKKIQKTPIYFWVMDLWPESLEIAGGVKNKSVLNYYKRVVQGFYKESEKILITSKGFRKSILEKGDFADKIEYFPNWAEESISEGETNYPIPNLPEGFKILFAGNVGEAQDMDTIMKAALLLKSHKEIKFVIVGDGRKMPFVQDFIKEHKLQETVHTVGRFPVEAMATFFSKADLLLVSLKDDPIFNLTVPAKVQAYMSSGKPILAMLNGEGADTINEADCGFAVPASNEIKLSEVIKEASILDKRVLEKMGRNGKLYFNERFTLKSCIDNLEKILKNK
ncbi:glycosyltransferase family 4 protein [Flavobacterium sp. xlx-214]|uniref:glycosyltransferase family 4 protein n=1 Tax=unclassified Flavobacterium TaxID=196869 RepID=UPI0013D5D986|nr:MULTISPECIES: glycosyltransferase family 4 protein [unclassified Flavobacterium]MBA5794021.1 glycosyltransferase family 4 protein [Flavobacterium sp. xlx-221]QMI83164.1 glycosyltransferase family 4 protein [Flavobacterium sp. xlx-214]